MKSTIPILSLLTVLLGNTAQANTTVEVINQTLDGFHQAASQAQFDQYFAYFHPHAVFLGTDATERWDIEEFKAYVKPRFAGGRGWTYKVVKRNISVAKSGEYAWFDEILDNASYGKCRGTGVLSKVGASWKINQYHLTIPIPNDLAPEVVKMIDSKKH